jgi:hypothetical protein
MPPEDDELDELLDEDEELDEDDELDEDEDDELLDDELDEEEELLDDELDEDDELLDEHPMQGPRPLPVSLQTCTPMAPPGQAHATCCPGMQTSLPEEDDEDELLELPDMPLVEEELADEEDELLVVGALLFPQAAAESTVQPMVVRERAARSLVVVVARMAQPPSQKPKLQMPAAQGVVAEQDAQPEVPGMSCSSM